MLRSWTRRLSICEKGSTLCILFKSWVRSAAAPDVRGGGRGVEGSGNREEARASLAARLRPHAGSPRSREVVLDRRSGPRRCRVLADPGRARPDASGRGRDGRAALRGYIRRGEPGAGGEAQRRGAVARGLLRQRRRHRGPGAARGATAGGGAGAGRVPGGSPRPAGVEAGRGSTPDSARGGRGGTGGGRAAGRARGRDKALPGLRPRLPPP